jgi:4-amino-4-deoxy-L-arabinose transferase-like glycosyltransferase
MQSAIAPRLSSSTLSPFLLLALFLAGLGLRLLVLANNPFDGLYGQDAYAYYDFAGELRLAANTGNAPPAFFWSLGYPALLAAVFSVFGGAPAVGQALNIVLAALLPPLVYVIARQTGLTRSSAFAAALIMLCCGQALQSSIVLMADIPALFWATLSACALLAYQHDRRRAWLVLSAVALSLACISRWLYLILLVPFALTYLSKRGSVRHLLIAGLCATLIFLPQIAYSIHSPTPVLNHAWVQGWSPVNAFEHQFVNLDGTFSYEQVNALFYAHPFYEPGYIAPILTPLLVVGLWALRKRPESFALLAGWALLPYAFLAGIPYQNIRFALIVVPPTAVLCGAGLERTLSQSRLLRPVFFGALVGLGSAWMLGAGMTVTHSFVQRNSRDVSVAAWLAEQVPQGATVYSFDITLTLQHRTALTVFDLYFETPDSLRAKWEIGRDDFLLVNLWQLHNQWRGREPYNAVAWLQAYRGLDRIGQQGNYTLFRVPGI